MKFPTLFTAVLFIAVATTWLPSQTKADTCAAPLSQFIIQGESIAWLPFNSSQECCDKCLAYPDCKAYMYFGGYKASPATCTFFRSITSGQYTSPYDLKYATTFVAERSVPAVSAWGKCGDEKGGYTPCVDGYYCMPWDSANYQCIQKPDKCEVETNVDYYGNDIKTLVGITPGDCCDECTKISDCAAYTFVNNDPDGKTKCYLKTSPVGGIAKTGVFSGRVKNIPAWGKCGDKNGYNSCVDGYYCMPWDQSYYQCIQKPTKCSVETNIDYYGNDIKTVVGITPGDCCEQCSTTSGCKAYTFVNDDPDGKTKCYLKTSAAGRTAKTGVFSGTYP